MPSDLPKLTKPQMARLVEIGTTRGRASYRDSPVLTKGLEILGLVQARGGKVAKTGRVVWHADAVLTTAGEHVLAGFPDDEFDKFRVMLADTDPRPRGAAGEGGTS